MPHQVTLARRDAAGPMLRRAGKGQAPDWGWKSGRGLPNVGALTYNRLGVACLGRRVKAIVGSQPGEAGGWPLRWPHQVLGAPAATGSSEEGAWGGSTWRCGSQSSQRGRYQLR